MDPIRRDIFSFWNLKGQNSATILGFGQGNIFLKRFARDQSNDTNGQSNLDNIHVYQLCFSVVWELLRRSLSLGFEN